MDRSASVTVGAVLVAPHRGSSLNRSATRACSSPTRIPPSCSSWIPIERPRNSRTRPRTSCIPSATPQRVGGPRSPRVARDRSTRSAGRWRLSSRPSADDTACSASCATRWPSCARTTRRRPHTAARAVGSSRPGMSLCSTGSSSTTDRRAPPRDVRAGLDVFWTRIARRARIEPCGAVGCVAPDDF